MELSPQQDVYYIDTVSPIDYFIDTVTPSAIQLNKEKTMSIELDGPLYLGSNSLQQQVDQNTEDITELQSDVSSIEGDIGSLDNLATSDKSSLVNAINETLSVLDPTQTADYIKNSKGLESGEISTNASILPWVEEMSHSTFDRSKFTVVGSPTITDDGIARGFSTTSWLTKTLTSFAPSQNWKIHYRILTPPSLPSIGNYYMVGSIGSAPNRVYIRFSSTSLGVELYKSGDSTIFLVFNDAPPPFNTWCDIEFGQEKIGTTIKTYIRYKRAEESDISYVEKSSTSSSELLIPSSNTIYIGNWYNYTTQNFPYNSSIDLKQFSITVDGVEVFSGNKTGIDTIKPDDYTVVGTPTISADGMLSDPTATNYVYGIMTSSFATANSWQIDTDIHINSLASIQRVYQNRTTEGGNLNAIILEVRTNRELRLYLSNSATGDIANGVSLNYTVTLNEIISTSLIFTGTAYEFYVNGNKVWTLSSTTKVSATSRLHLFSGTNGINGVIGAQDLNSFRIYIDGDLVYQPCLKIPYTESKTGSKIVNSIYRDRVNDMAEQFGYANYYTLDETNGNFTLPQVELYGLIGQRTLRDSYRNGINYWELYSNRDLEQGGSCTSGVEVTFARPFVDTNYVLSVPYSAKSTTAFTPTQTGDWIAKGKGLL